MWRNYFVITLRCFGRQKLYAGINLLGLSTGITCCLLIFLYVQHELSYDQFWPFKDRLYRFYMEYNFGGREGKTAMTPTALAPTLQRTFAEVQKATRVSTYGHKILRNGDQLIQEDRFYFADSSFFEILQVPFLAGNPSLALVAPSSVVLAASTADKYFADVPYSELPGKTLNASGREYKITGVIEDLPPNTHMPFDFMASFSTLDASRSEIWGNANYYTYALLNKGANVAGLKAKIDEVMEKMNEDQGSGGNRTSFGYMPVTSIHLDSQLNNDPFARGDRGYVYIFSGVALLILVIACINYMNLATARAAGRAREVGVRKALGAVNSQIRRQFLGEAGIITFFSLVLAVIATWLLLPWFSTLVNRPLSPDYQMFRVLLPALLPGWVLISLLSGGYPAFVLARYKVVHVIKGKIFSKPGGGALRKTLVVIQFSISVFLITVPLILLRQMNFIKERNTGYDRDQVLGITIDSKIWKNLGPMRQQLSGISGVEGLTVATESPVNVGGGYTIAASHTAEGQQTGVNAIGTDRHFISLFNIKLLHGRNFTEAEERASAPEVESEKRRYAMILNETAVRKMGFAPENALEQPVTLNGRRGKIVGVMQDFHYQSLHKPIESLVLFTEQDYADALLLKLSGGDMAGKLGQVEFEWKKLVAHRPFIYHFLDDEFNQLYQSEERLSNAFGIFAALAILIACLGMFGLAAFTAQRRLKEISIRKILGASPAAILRMLSLDFTRLVLIALVLALPVGWYLMNNWLQENFVYRVNTGFEVPLVAALLVTGVALLTVGYHSLRAANGKPVDALRSE